MSTHVFSANAGDIVRFRVGITSGSAWAGVTLFDPTGATSTAPVCQPTLAEIPALTLTKTGQHTLLVQDCFGASAATYGLWVQRLSNPGNASPIAFGQVVSGSIQPAEGATHTFVASAGDVVDIRVALTGGSFWPGIDVYDPTGKTVCKQVCQPTFAQTGPCTLAVAGTYTVVVYDCFSGIRTGSYNLQVQRLGGPVGPGLAVPTPYGRTLSGSIQVGEAVGHTFLGNAGDRVQVTVASAAFWPGIDLFDPNGVKVGNVCRPSSATLGPSTLASAGRYTLSVFDCFSGIKSGAYTLALSCVSAQCGAAGSFVVPPPSSCSFSGPGHVGPPLGPGSLPSTLVLTPAPAPNPSSLALTLGNAAGGSALLVVGPGPCGSLGTLPAPPACWTGASLYPTPLLVLGITGSPATVTAPISWVFLGSGASLCLQGYSLTPAGCVWATGGYDLRL